MERALNILSSIITITMPILALFDVGGQFLSPPKMTLIEPLSAKLIAFFFLQGSFAWAFALVLVRLCARQEAIMIVGVISICLISAWQTVFFLSYFFFGSSIESGWGIVLFILLLTISLGIDLFVFLFEREAHRRQNLEPLAPSIINADRAVSRHDRLEGTIGALNRKKSEKKATVFAGIWLVVSFLLIAGATLAQMDYSQLSENEMLLGIAGALMVPSLFVVLATLLFG